MLKIIEGTIFDLSPGVWAGVIIVALLVIEVFQLGPHSFKRCKGFSSAPSSSRETKTGVKNMKKPRSKGKKGSETRRRKRKESLKWLKEKPLQQFILINAPCSVIYLNQQGNEAGALLPHSLSNDILSPNSATVYPDKIEGDNNYVVAHGEESDVAVLEKLEELSKASRDVEQIFFFSSSVPSVYALQKFIDLKEVRFDEKVEASVLYEEMGTDLDSIAFQQRQDFLVANDVSLEKIVLVDDV